MSAKHLKPHTGTRVVKDQNPKRSQIVNEKCRFIAATNFADENGKFGAWGIWDVASQCWVVVPSWDNVGDAQREAGNLNG